MSIQNLVETLAAERYRLPLGNDPESRWVREGILGMVREIVESTLRLSILRMNAAEITDKIVEDHYLNPEPDLLHFTVALVRHFVDRTLAIAAEIDATPSTPDEDTQEELE